MQPNSTPSNSKSSNSPSRQIRRKSLYGLTFALLCAMALYGVWFADGVSAYDTGSLPPGQTIPPGGTVPPATEPMPDQGQVNIIHLAPFASDLIDTGIQVCDTAGNPVTSYIYYQQQTGYLYLAMGTYDWVVAEAGSNCSVLLPGLDIPPFFVADGTRLTLLIFGDDDNQPLDSMLLVERVGKTHYRFPLMYSELTE